MYHSSELRPASGLETKFVAVSELSEVGADGTLQGYASLFGQPDRSGDVVMPGAFAASLAGLAEAGRRVKFLWQHDPAQPIGIWESVSEDGRGLLVKGTILTDVRMGSDAVKLMAAGAIDGLSIGYRTVRAEPNPATGGRKLHEIDLWEVSLVTFPMLPTARAMLGAVTPSDVMEQALAEALSA